MDEFDKAIDDLKKEVKRELIKEGRAAIAHARRNGNYKNRRGRLRKSLGFAVTDDGVEHIQANEITTKLIENNDTEGISLILADGMPYGSYVEAKGYDVLSSAYLRAKENLQKQ